MSAVECKATILVVDDEPDNRFALSHVLAELEQRIVEAASGEEALRFLLRDEMRSDPARRKYAGPGRLRDRRADPPSRALAAHPDHFRQRDRQGRRAHRARLCDGRGRLRVQAGRPGDPALEDRGAGRPVSQERGSAAQAQLERMLQEENLRIRQEKLEAERQLRQIEERQTAIVRSLPIVLYSARLKGRFSGPRFVSEGTAQAIGFPAARFVEDPDLWPERIHPEDRERVLADVAAIQTSGGMSAEYRWLCADGSHRWFLDRAGADPRSRRASAGDLRQLPRHRRSPADGAAAVPGAEDGRRSDS
jgi:CheY-like chemotaxis protein